MATPRRLPAPPSSGFRSLAQGTPLKTFATPVHPALTATTPHRTSAAVPKTPLDDIKRRLELIRKGEGRRATVGFVLPSTPAQRSATIPNASYTVIAASKRQEKINFNLTPPRSVAERGESEEEEEDEVEDEDEADDDLESIEEKFGAEQDTGMEVDLGDGPFDIPAEMEDPFVSEPVIDAAGKAPDSALVGVTEKDLVEMPVLPITAALKDILPEREEHPAHLSLESSSRLSIESSSTDPETVAAVSAITAAPVKIAPSTPSFAGLKEMIHAPLPPKTPNFAGLKNLYPALQAESATPSFAGIKRMMAGPAVVPPTPSFVGVKDMYRTQKEASAAVLDGVAELYDMPEEEELDEEVDEEIEDVIEVQEEIEDREERPAKKAAITAPQATASSSKPSLQPKSRKPAMSEQLTAATAFSGSAPAKRVRSIKTTGNTGQAGTSLSAPTRRAAPAEAVESRSVSTRTRRSATVESETMEVKPTLPRTRRAPTVEDDAPSKASTSRSRSTRKMDAMPSVTAPIAEEEASSKPTRSRAVKKTAAEKPVLVEADDDQVIEVKEEPTSKPSRAKRAAPAKTVEKAEEVTTSKSSRTTSRKVKEDKENEPAAGEVAVKKPPLKRAARKVAEVAGEVAPVRVTRSRK
jgi:hypothetical protein